MKIEGRFLPMFAGTIPFLTGTVLPALRVRILSGLVSTGVQKLIGNGLYIKKEGPMNQCDMLSAPESTHFTWRLSVKTAQRN